MAINKSTFLLIEPLLSTQSFPYWMLGFVLVAFATPALATPGAPDTCGEWSTHTVPAPAAYPDLPILHVLDIDTDGETAWFLGYATDAQGSASGYFAASWNGESWQEESLPVIDEMTLVEMELAAGHVWLTGWIGSLTYTSRPLVIRRQLDGGEWQQDIFTGPHTEGDGALNIKVFSTTDYWLIGRGGRLMHWNGLGLTGEFLYGTMIDLDGLSSNDLWAVGYVSNSSQAHHYDGESWTPVSIPDQPYEPSRLYNVLIRATDDVWMFGHTYGAADINYSFGKHWNGSEIVNGGGLGTVADHFGPDSMVSAGAYLFGPGYWDPGQQQWRSWRLPQGLNGTGAPLSAFGACRLWMVSHGDGTSDELFLLTPAGIFWDDFEIGDLSAWSSAVGN